MDTEGPNSMDRYYTNLDFEGIYTSIWKINQEEFGYRRQKKKSEKVGSYTKL
jgi:hypothetical protein